MKLTKSCDCHLIFYELKKLDVKIDVIPDELQKYIAFITNKNLVFIDIMQFMNSSLEKLAVKKSSKKTTTIFSRQ